MPSPYARPDNRLSTRPSLLRRLVLPATLSGLPWLLLLVVMVSIGLARAADDEQRYLARDDVRQFIQTVSDRHGLDRNRLAGLFALVEPQQSILEAIARPAEKTLTYRQYRPIFVTDKRVAAGRRYLEEHRELFERAERVQGVPASVVAAIIGVETFYGRITGRHGVLESLTTLAFDYPPRSGFFRSELEAFLVLSDAEDWNPTEIRGSYAGAMGTPQFISSSYRDFAIDFDGDGQRDLFGSTADIIGSVAHYLRRHGWQPGQAVAERWTSESVDGEAVSALVRKELRPAVTAAEVRELGFDSPALSVATAEGEPVSVMQVAAEGGDQTWIGYTNFYAITRYNHSVLYALAVHELAQELEAAAP